jgi:LysM repeat protein
MLTLPQTRWQRRLLPLLIVLLMSGWLLIACERTLPGGDDTPDLPVVEQPQDVDVDPVEDTPVDEPVEEADPVSEPEAEVTPDPADTPREDEPSEEEVEEPDADERDEVAETEEEVEAAEEEETTEPAPTSEEATPTVHTVARGESLYRIGLQYGVSWVRLAQFNNITNPNRITVGQQIRIPGPSDPIPQPTPSPHTETTYIVRAGDNLFRIGLMYGISWVQIAEANGLVNPNQIYAGQELKIPVEASGPTPEFTHTVRAGETLFRISLRYGVPWQVIAEANGLESPYVIYVGQTLIIPGG